MLDAVQRAIDGELRWPRSMVERLEIARPGSGLRWAAERVARWIEATKPDGYQELLRLIPATTTVESLPKDAASLAEEARRIWYLWLEDVYPQRSAARFYEALAALASGDREGYIQSLATAVFIAASRENFSDGMFRELQVSFDRALEASAVPLDGTYSPNTLISQSE